MVTMGVIEGCRILSGWKGNLTESKGSIGVSLVLVVPAVLSCVYLLVLLLASQKIIKCVGTRRS